MKDFILTPGYAINPAHISFVRFPADGSVAIQVGGNSILVDGEAGAELRKLFVPDETVTSNAKTTRAKADAAEADAKTAEAAAVAEAKADAGEAKAAAKAAK